MGSWCFPRPDEICNPSSSGSVLGSPPSWSCLECTQEASYQTPNHLIWLHPTWRSSSSIPRSVWIFLTHSGVIRSAEKEMEHFREYGPNLWNQTWVVRSRGKVWWPGLVPWDLAKKNIGTQPGKTTWSLNLWANHPQRRATGLGAICAGWRAKVRTWASWHLASHIGSNWSIHMSFLMELMERDFIDMLVIGLQTQTWVRKMCSNGIWWKSR